MSAPGAVLVTGASSGIGRACALALDARGFRVFAGYRRDEDAESLRRDGSDRLHPVRLDVTDPASIAAAVDTVRAAVGHSGLAGLVNNAGISIAAPLELVPLDELRRQLEVNVVGQVAVTQAFLPLLRAGAGRIVNIGSISGRFAAPLLGPYAASKHALEALSDALRVELRPWRIHVAIVEPGAIDTPIWQRSRALAQRMIDTFPPAAAELYARPIARLQRMVDHLRPTPTTPVVDAVLHALTAARPRARYVVGRDARLRLALTWLPTPLRDRLVARALGLR